MGPVGLVLGAEDTCDELAEAHAYGAADQELLSSNSVDVVDGRDRGHDVDNSNHTSGKQRNSIILESKGLENNWRIVDDGIDAAG